MTNKERVHAALEGNPVERTPVTSLYNHLYRRDHFSELTGRPQWELHKWVHSQPDEYVRLFREIHKEAPFEILQPDAAPSRQARESVEFVEKDGQVFQRNKRSGKQTLVRPGTASGHATDYAANEKQLVFDKKDVAEKVKPVRAEDQIASGINDYAEAVVKALGRREFIMAGGVVGTFYQCSAYVGLTNLFGLLKENPDLIECLSRRILEQNIEHIRRLCAAGGDAVFIDDAMTTCDMISLKDYERFSLPYMKAMVEEIHRLGHKAILIYFGGIADRLDPIASIGADGLSMEASMKGYVNDIEETAVEIGSRVSLFGNVDPVGVLQDGTDGQLEAEARRQGRAGRLARGFILCTGSPITPATPLSRVRKFLGLGGAC